MGSLYIRSRGPQKEQTKHHYETYFHYKTYDLRLPEEIPGALLNMQNVFPSSYSTRWLFPAATHVQAKACEMYK